MDPCSRHRHLDGFEVTTPARPIPATISVDRLTTSQQLSEFAQFEHQLDGTQPFVRVVRVDASGAVLDLLPPDASVERCVTTDNCVSVLARMPGASLHIEAWPRATTIRVAAMTHTLADEIAERLRREVPKPAAGTVSVRIWHHNCDRSATSADRSIQAQRWGDIATNYPGRVRQSIDALTALESPVGAGKLILWHGPPGTGKTTALRALMRAWSTWCQPQYIADPEKFFAEPAYMTQVLTTVPVAKVGPSLGRAAEPESVWRLVVAEDSDEYLRASARRDAGAALGRLLNLADGILGQGMNVLLLLTTNEETSRLHPALVRPGRCLAAVEFPAFDAAEASEWLGRSVDQSMTLAELLERRGDLTRFGVAPQRRESVGQYL